MMTTANPHSAFASSNSSSLRALRRTLVNHRLRLEEEARRRRAAGTIAAVVLVPLMMWMAHAT